MEEEGAKIAGLFGI